MINTRSRSRTARAAFCHVELPRTEERTSPGEVRPHTVYLVRLESHLGKYPSPDTWFELRYSRFQHLHQNLRELHPSLRLPVLPRSRPRWLTTHHPEYVRHLAEELRHYLRQLLAYWIQAYGGFDSFIQLMHAVNYDAPLPPPPPGGLDAGDSQRASVDSGALPSLGASALSAGDGAAALAELDGAALDEALCWREYEEHVERLLELGTGAAEMTPFEEDESISDDRPHVWRIVGFSVRRVPCVDAHAPLKLHTTDAYILLAPPTKASTAAAAPAAAPAAAAPTAAEAGISASGGSGSGTGEADDKAWRIFYWLGAACTADKSGAAAALVVQLSGLLSADGSAALHRREVEGDESAALLGAFSHVQVRLRRVGHRPLPCAHVRALARPRHVCTLAPLRPPPACPLAKPTPCLLALADGAGRLLGRMARAHERTARGSPLPRQCGPRLPGRGHARQANHEVAHRRRRVRAPVDRPPPEPRLLIAFPSPAPRRRYVLDAPAQPPPHDASQPGWVRLEAASHALPSTVYQWHGYEAPLRAKATALLLANTIRCLDRRGVASVHVLGAAEAPEASEATGAPSASLAAPGADDGGGSGSGAAGAHAAAAPGPGEQPPSPTARSALEASRYFWSVLRANEVGPPIPPPLPSTPLVLYTLSLVGCEPTPLPPPPPLRSSPPRPSPRTSLVDTPAASAAAAAPGARSPRPSLPGGPASWLGNLFRKGDKEQTSPQAESFKTRTGDADADARGGGGGGGSGSGSSGAPAPAAEPERRAAYELQSEPPSGAASAGGILESPSAPPSPGGATVEPAPAIKVRRARVEVTSLHSISSLLTNSTVVLDCGGEMYVWCGTRTGGYLRWAARMLAERLRSGGERRHDRVPVLRESEGCESASFRAKFATWHWLREANPAGLKVAAFSGAGGNALLPSGRRAPQLLSISDEVARMRRQRDAILSKQRKREEAEAPSAAPSAAPSTALPSLQALPMSPAPGSMGPPEAWQSPLVMPSPGVTATPGGALDTFEGRSPLGRFRSCTGSMSADMDGEVVAAEGRVFEASAAGGEWAKVDPETEAVNVWLVGGDVFELLPEDEAGVFWSANAYMVLYSYAIEGRQRSSLWFWKGADVTPLNFLTWRFQLSQLLQSMPENPVPRTITQGEEPERFLAVMEGTIILSGAHPLTRADPRRASVSVSGAIIDDYVAFNAAAAAGGGAEGAAASGGAASSSARPLAASASADGHGANPLLVESLPSLRGVVLLQVKRYAPTPLGVCARQVPARVYYLDSRDGFLLLHAADATLFLWAGRHAPRPLLKATQAM